jgi:FG-GAP-like repeat
VRTRVLKAVVALALAVGSVTAVVPSQRAGAAGALSLSWSTTVHVGSGSGPASTVSAQPLGGATVADLFGDARKQVVVGFMDGSVSVLDGTTGAELPGWPQYTGGAMHTNPSVADLNNDGREEVVAASEAGRVYVWNADGSLAPGWPQHSNPPGHTNPGFFGGVAIGDLFGDGNKELVAASWDQHLYAWNKDGGLLPGFPIHVWDTAFDTPALVDLEHRGQLDIVIGFDSTGPPYDPYPQGGEMWAFRPTGCVANAYANQSGCALAGWPRTFDQVPWASPAAVDLLNNGSTDIIDGTGFNFNAPAGQYVNAWTAGGAALAGWPQATAGRNMASPAVGDLFGNGQREVVEASSPSGSPCVLYAWNGNGNTLAGWPITLSANGFFCYPTIAPISSNANGVWIIDGATLKGFNNAGQLAWSAGGLDWGGFAAPAIADLGTGQLSAVTVDQTTQSSFNSWTVRAFAIPGTTKMLTGAWPTFHGNSQLTGTILPSATMSALSPTQSTTGISVNWTLDANSVPASGYTLWVKDQGSGGWAPYGRSTSTSLPFDGYPGHTYSFAIQAGAAEPSFAAGAVSTTFSGSATWSTPFKEMYAVDGHGLLHPGSSAPIANANSWPTWDIVRGVAISTGGLGGYLLDGYGGVHSFGNAPSVTVTTYWSGWDIARGLVLRADGHSGYVLDGWGGLHPFGTSGDIAPSVNSSAYWQGWDIARDVQLRGDGQSGYVLDGWGGLHAFGVTGDMAPNVQTSGWWQGWDIAHRFALDSAGNGGYVLDGFGGLHGFGTPGNAPPTASQTTGYWPGWDIAHGIVFIPGSATQGYVADGWGGMHPFGGAPAASAPNATPGGIIKQLSIA